MTFKVTNANDILVKKRAVKLVDQNASRSELNIWAGDFPLWFGNEEVPSGTIGNKVEKGERVVLKLRGEVWVIRAAGDSGPCSFSQEIKANG